MSRVRQGRRRLEDELFSTDRMLGHGLEILSRLKKDYGDRIALWDGVAVGAKRDNFMAMLDEHTKLCQY